MANNTIQLKRSSVAGKQPNTSTLAVGELALNLTDQKIYSSNGTGIFEPGANSTTLYVGNSSVALSANSSRLTIPTAMSISANGGVGTANQVLTTNGTGVYWANASGGSSSSGGIISQQQYTGDGTTTTFTFTSGYTSNALSVYLNGVLLRNGTEANVISGSTFTITPAPASGALIDAISFSGIFANGVSTVISQQFTANGTANSFTVTGGYIPNQVQVYLNGVKQLPGTDVIITSGNTVNFSVTPANSYIVDVYGVQNSITLTSNTLIINGTLTTNAITANGSVGSNGQILTSNGSTVYWSNAVAGATGGGTDKIFWENDITITSNYTITTNKNAMTAGPVTVSNGVIVTIPSGSVWTIV
jgi:hypothetical protein